MVVGQLALAATITTHHSTCTLAPARLVMLLLAPANTRVAAFSQSIRMAMVVLQRGHLSTLLQDRPTVMGTLGQLVSRVVIQAETVSSTRPRLRTH